MRSNVKSLYCHEAFVVLVVRAPDIEWNSEEDKVESALEDLTSEDGVDSRLKVIPEISEYSVAINYLFDFKQLVAVWA